MPSSKSGTRASSSRSTRAPCATNCSRAALTAVRYPPKGIGGSGASAATITSTIDRLKHPHRGSRRRADRKRQRGADEYDDEDREPNTRTADLRAVGDHPG